MELTNQQLWERESKKAFALLSAIMQEGSPWPQELSYLLNWLEQNRQFLDEEQITALDTLNEDLKPALVVEGIEEPLNIPADQLQALYELMHSILEKKHRFPYGKKANGEPYSRVERAIEILERDGSFINFFKALNPGLPVQIEYTSNYHPEWLGDNKITGKYVVDDGYRITYGDDLLEQLPQEVLDLVDKWLDQTYVPGENEAIDELLKTES